MPYISEFEQVNKFLASQSSQKLIPNGEGITSDSYDKLSDSIDLKFRRGEGGALERNGIYKAFFKDGVLLEDRVVYTHKLDFVNPHFRIRFARGDIFKGLSLEPTGVRLPDQSVTVVHTDIEFSTHYGTDPSNTHVFTTKYALEDSDIEKGRLAVMFYSNPADRLEKPEDYNAGITDKTFNREDGSKFTVATNVEHYNVAISKDEEGDIFRLEPTAYKGRENAIMISLGNLDADSLIELAKSPDEKWRTLDTQWPINFTVRGIS